MSYQFTKKHQPIEVWQPSLVDEYNLCKSIMQQSKCVETKQYNLGRMSVIEELLVHKGLDRLNPFFEHRNTVER